VRSLLAELARDFRKPLFRVKLILNERSVISGGISNGGGFHKSGAMGFDGMVHFSIMRRLMVNKKVLGSISESLSEIIWEGWNQEGDAGRDKLWSTYRGT